MKEEERIERIIRGLLKQTDNRRCINCNSLGPQYVCTTFWTFICTNCSGIHREFTHRVKSVSMAKFTADEVSALQAGGNERARRIYFKTWDPSRNFYPDGSLNKLRDLIKRVYVDRKFSGDRSLEKLSMVEVGSKDVYDERRSFERSTPSAREAFVARHSFESSSLGDRRSYEKSSRGAREDLYDRTSLEKYTATRKNDERNLRYCIDQLRSPRYTQEHVRQRTRPARFEIVDDRFREDGSGNVTWYEHYRFSKAESRRGSKSPDSRRVRNEPSPPVVRPVKDIMGDEVLELKVGEPPKPKEGKETDSSADAEKTGGSTNSSGSVNAKANPNEVVQPINLIDFETDPQSPAVTSTQSMQPIESSKSSGTSSTNENASTVDSLECLLYGLSPAVAPTEITSLVPVADDATTANLEITPSRAAAEASPVAEILALPGPEDSETKVQNEQQLHSTQNQPSTFPSAINSISPQQSISLVVYNQHSTSEPSPNFGKQAAFSRAPQQSSQPASTPAQNASTGNDLKSSGRKELPAELFTSSYTPLAAASSGWQFCSPHGMEYGMQYHPNAKMLVSAKSRNPFDIGDESPQVPAPMFPSMLPLQGTPNISPSPPFQPQPLPYALLSPQPATSYGMAIPTGAYVGQQLTNNMLITGHQEGNSSETRDSAFASLNPLHHSSGGITYQMPSTSHHSSSTRGNPFS